MLVKCFYPTLESCAPGGLLGLPVQVYNPSRGDRLSDTQGLDTIGNFEAGGGASG